MRLTMTRLMGLAMLMTACGGRPAEGDSCTGSVAACADEHTFLQCDDGQLRVRAMCRGSNGCSTAEGTVRCDETLGVDGEPCSAAEGAGTCAVDGSAMLRCEAGTFHLAMHCRGARACHREEAQVRCDASIAEEGDVCTAGAACSVDGASFLHCVEGAMHVARECPGPEHCHEVEHNVLCDAGPFGVERLAGLRAHFSCGTPTASPTACAAIDGYASGHVPTAPTSGQAYLGIQSCTHEGHEYQEIVLAPTEGGARVSRREVFGVSAATERSWDALVAALASPDLASTDAEVVTLFTRARQSPAIVEPDSPVWSVDTARDAAAVDDGFETALLREANGRLYALVDRNHQLTCISELRSVGGVEIDGNPVVSCQSQSYVTGLELSQCEDGHIYAAICAGERCTCARDGMRGHRTFTRAEGAFVTSLELRRGCSYPVL